MRGLVFDKGEMGQQTMKERGRSRVSHCCILCAISESLQDFHRLSSILSQIRLLHRKGLYHSVASAVPERA